MHPRMLAVQGSLQVLLLAFPSIHGQRRDYAKIQGKGSNGAELSVERPSLTRDMSLIKVLEYVLP